MSKRIIFPGKIGEFPIKYLDLPLLPSSIHFPLLVVEALVEDGSSGRA